MTEPTPSRRAELRDEIAKAIHRYDNHHALSGNDIPSKHHYGEADFVIAELRHELDALSALRQVARGYCPHCGRGDAAPTTDDWERERQRANEAEDRLRRIADGHPRADAIQAEIGEMIAQTHELRDQLRTAEAALARIARLADEHPAGIDTALVLEALPDPAATEPHTGLVVQPYRDDHGQPRWVFRCWDTDTCDGWLSLDHHTQQSAQRARDRHVTEEHTAPAPAATPAADKPA